MVTPRPVDAMLRGDALSRTGATNRVARTSRDAGGNDKAYLYDFLSSDHLQASGNMAQLSNATWSVALYDFALVQATSSKGGTDTRTILPVDYVLETVGPWSDA